MSIGLPYCLSRPFDYEWASNDALISGCPEVAAAEVAAAKAAADPLVAAYKSAADRVMPAYNEFLAAAKEAGRTPDTIIYQTKYYATNWCVSDADKAAWTTWNTLCDVSQKTYTARIPADTAIAFYKEKVAVAVLVAEKLACPASFWLAEKQARIDVKFAREELTKKEVIAFKAVHTSAASDFGLAVFNARMDYSFFDSLTPETKDYMDAGTAYKAAYEKENFFDKAVSWKATARSYVSF
jgi:hypothetical protein